LSTFGDVSGEFPLACCDGRNKRGVFYMSSVSVINKTEDVDVKTDINLVDYAEQVTGSKAIKSGKTFFLNPCPVCGHHDHFSISQSNEGIWLYKSFANCINGPGNGGSIIDFVIHIEKAAQDVNGALEHLANQRFTPKKQTTETETKKEIVKRDFASDFAELSSKPGYRAYFRSRGISDETIGKYLLCSHPDGLNYFLQKYPDSFEEKTWAKYSKYCHFIPILEPDGSIHQFITRFDGQPEKGLKYRNLKGRPARIFNDRIILDPASAQQRIFVVEGAMDALSLIDVGVSAVGLNSASMADRFLKLVKQQREHLKDKVFVLCGDADHAGNEMNQKLANGLLAMDLKCAVLSWKQYKDANDFLKADREAFIEHINQDLEILTQKSTLEKAFPGYDVKHLKIPEEFTINEFGVIQTIQTIKGTFEKKLLNRPALYYKTFEDVDSKEERVQIIFQKGNRVRDLIVEPPILFNKSKLIELSRFGLPVRSGNASGLSELFGQMAELNDHQEPEKLVSRYGWVDNTFTEFFPYGGKKTTQYIQGEKLFTTKGDIDIWKAWVIEHFLSNPLALFILSVAPAAPLLKVLGMRTFWAYLYGKSGGGKTAVEYMALSFWGHPLNMFGSFRDTNVGIEGRLSLANNLPLAIDEKQMLDERRSLSQIIYETCNPKGKSRGQKDGSLREAKRWTTIIISSGEEPAIEDHAKGGEVSRVLEIEGTPFPHKPEIAKETYHIAQNHFGLAGQIYVPWLIERIQTGKLHEDYERIYRQLKASHSDKREQHISYTAIICLGTVYMLKSVFDIEEPWDIAVRSGIEVLGMIRTEQELSEAQRFHDYLVDHIAENSYKFPSHHDGDQTYHSIDGWRNEKTGEIYFIPSRFDAIAKEKGFRSGKILRKEMAEELGCIQKFKETRGQKTVTRYDKQIRIGKKRQRVIVFKPIEEKNASSETSYDPIQEKNNELEPLAELMRVDPEAVKKYFP
jgi:5S rRNA maturation endonuclease (ribonuclease M5)